uniref:non-specific serine/threonine protein kinase n=1 Tax=Compsopogon caeruleus TaxID=31354 RepID=A0A6T6C1L9_9RHOD|mmetsp:Transcript_2571/g.4550  ORF Transcript_2571/g.4550 Transcript_2571/m.4550 type:complete len:289 (+) Transcript_2571:2-868(+)
MAPRVGEYWLREKLGSGAFSEVRAAEHVLSGEQMAVKIINRSRIEPGSRAHKFVKSEIEILRALNHPNIVHIHRVIRSTKNLYIIMDKLTGGDLFDKVISFPSSRLDENTARSYSKQLADALLFLHKHGVYHRDVKPENVLLDQFGGLKLADLGMCATAFPDKLALPKVEPLLHDRVGTSSYIAPEVLRGQPYLGSLADVWSFGIVIFVMVKGRFPFSSKNYDAIYRRILARTPVDIGAEFSAELRDLVRAMLLPDPNQRITMTEVVEHPWLSSETNKGTNNLPRSGT